MSVAMALQPDHLTPTFGSGTRHSLPGPLHASFSGDAQHAFAGAPCGRSALQHAAWRRPARPAPVPAPGSRAARRGRASTARRSSPPRSRSARSRQHRRPAGWRRWPRRAASATAWRISAEPIPRALQRRVDARAGRAAAASAPPSPSETSHSRTVPTTAPAASRATKARPSDGRRPRRSFSRRLAPPARTHRAVEQRIARGNVVRPLDVDAGSAASWKLATVHGS